MATLGVGAPMTRKAMTRCACSSSPNSRSSADASWPAASPLASATSVPCIPVLPGALAGPLLSGHLRGLLGVPAVAAHLPPQPGAVDAGDPEVLQRPHRHDQLDQAGATTVPADDSHPLEPRVPPVRQHPDLRARREMLQARLRMLTARAAWDDGADVRDHTPHERLLGAAHASCSLSWSSAGCPASSRSSWPRLASNLNVGSSAMCTACVHAVITLPRPTIALRISSISTVARRTVRCSPKRRSCSCSHAS